MKHILLVDDELSMLELLRRILIALGYHVTAASSGPEALSEIGSQPLDLVVTDYRMPEMNGWQLIAALQSRHPHLKALVISGQPPEDGDEQLWWRMQSTLAKPFSPRTLSDAVFRLIGHP
jgi:CheY-like chemotaxis protein